MNNNHPESSNPICAPPSAFLPICIFPIPPRETNAKPILSPPGKSTDILGCEQSGAPVLKHMHVPVVLPTGKSHNIRLMSLHNQDLFDMLHLPMAEDRFCNLIHHIFQQNDL